MVNLMPYFAVCIALYSIKHNAIMKAGNIKSDMYYEGDFGLVMGNWDIDGWSGRVMEV